ncbi:uncharacterized protein LAJ45_09848 [Morchella importuna]|uniref:uncharacterized protein n=1 Tax=Morchella importuna TaxID=1174673 RepID=UPI001E8E72D6|nr:uncharacterized protein LAJ45_09848 [Morchella importuna]KAH8146158.1 hypothetical protein LAJ45_09848 [Morchella importuna]
MRSHLEHLSNISPITSLAFLDTKSSPPLLLAGEGPFVKVVSTGPSGILKSLGPVRVFTRERVHGITLTHDESHVLFWGGRSIFTTSVSSLLSPGPKLDEIKAQDWIFHAVFLPTTNGSIKIVAITAHNSLLLYTPESGWAELASGERCMLYSAHLLHLPANSRSGESERILIAAGTVFGEILLWSTVLNPINQKCSAELHYRLLGHEGSIFGVNISPLYSERRYLASCSDDRTVRVWDVSNLSVSGTPEDVRDGTLKNTGFGHISSTKGGECVSLGWGHTARIWGVRFLPDLTENGQIRIVSISEDLTSKFWVFNPSSTRVPTGKNPAVELINTATYLLHSGKHIWSYDLHFERGLLATGGADGRVGLVEYNPIKGKEEEEWDMGTVLSNIGTNQLKGSKDTFKSYAVLDSNRFLVTTSQGRLLTYNLSTKAWTLITQCESLSSWSLVASWEDEGMVALGNGRGEVGVCYVDRNGEVEWWQAGGEEERGKVGGIWTSIGPGGENSGKTYNILTTTLSTTIFTLHTFTRVLNTTTHSPPLQLISPVEENTKRFLPTSLYISHTNTTPLIFLGSRNGALAVYCRTTAALLGVYHNIHSSDAITSITPYPSPTSSLSNSSVSIQTVGRNGGLAIHTFALSPEPSLSTIHSTAPTNCNVIEGASSSSHKHIWGFRGKNFFVHDEGKGVDIAVVECGGAHRAWCLYWKESTGWLVWTKASKVHIAPLPLYPQRPLTLGLHGREIKSIAFAPSTGLLATGAEDTLIRISSVNTITGSVEGIAVVKWHTTGVQQLVWSECGGWLFSSGGVEELAVWRVRDGGVVREAKGPCVDGDLRILGLGVIDVHGKDDQKVGFVVGAGLSDSSIKVYYYSLASRSFTLLSQGRYKTNCILQTTFTVHHSTGKVHLFIAATDGYVTVYDLSSLLQSFGFSISRGGLLLQESIGRVEMVKLPEILLTKRVHQSGVKAFEALVGEAGDVVVYTGGDDCALGITRVRFSGEEGARAETFMVPRAHASAVTAIVVMGSRVVSSAVSQEVKVWDMEMTGDAVKVRLLEEGYSCVADAVGAVGVEGREGEDGWVIVGGVGVDFWKVR